MGHAEPFAFDDAYRPASGILRFLTGTPSILALAALDAGLSTFEGVAMRDLAAKSRRLSELFVDRGGGALRLAAPARKSLATRTSAGAMSSSLIRTAMRSCRR